MKSEPEKKTEESDADALFKGCMQVIAITCVVVIIWSVKWQLGVASIAGLAILNFYTWDKQGKP